MIQKSNKIGSKKNVPCFPIQLLHPNQAYKIFLILLNAFFHKAYFKGQMRVGLSGNYNKAMTLIPFLQNRIVIYNTNR